MKKRTCEICGWDIINPRLHYQTVCTLKNGRPLPEGSKLTGNYSPCQLKKEYNRRQKLERNPHHKGKRGEVDNPDRKERICLGCDKPFLSEGRFLRICPNCKVSNEHVSHSLGMTFRVGTVTLNKMHRLVANRV